MYFHTCGLFCTLTKNFGLFCTPVWNDIRIPWEETYGEKYFVGERENSVGEKIISQFRVGWYGEFLNFE